MTAADGTRLADTTWRRATVLGWLANSIGVVVVFVAVGFLLAVFFSAGDRDRLGREAIPVIAVGVPILFIAVTWILTRERRAALAWLYEGREPTDDEHRRTLRIPIYVALVTLAGWAVGGIVAGVANLDHSVGAAVLATCAFWLGGETTSALAYLISERTMRPITTVALAKRPFERSAAPGVRDRLLFGWSLGTAVPVMSILVVGIAGLTMSGIEVGQVAGACVFLGSVALAVGMLITKISARAISDPLRSMRAAVDRIAAGDLDVEVPIDDSSEVGQLQAGFNRMAEGLRERERIRDLFGRQVGHEVAQAALRDGTRLGGEEREIGALFVDLTGSTSMSLAMPPTEVVRLLNKFFRVVIEVVESEGGFVNKFEGDAALCVFGAPVAEPGPRRAGALRRPPPGGAARARGARDRLRHRRLGRQSGCWQRRRRAPLRVHGDRRPGERGRPPVRPRERAPAAGDRLGRRARPRRPERARVVGDGRAHRAARPPRRDRPGPASDLTRTPGSGRGPSGSSPIDERSRPREPGLIVQATEGRPR